MNFNKYLLNDYPVQLRTNFINLYKDEIIDRLGQNPILWKEFNCILNASIIEEYLKNHIDASTNHEKHIITVDFFNKLVESSENNLLYSQLMDFLEIVDGELYQSLNISKWKGETFSTSFQKLLMVLHKLYPVFDVPRVVSYLNEYSSQLQHIYQPVLKRLENKEIDDDHAKSLIIRTLCITVDGATYHLLYAIYKSSDQGKAVVESIYPKFEIFYQKNIFEDRDGVIHFVQSGDNIADAIEDIMSNGNQSKHACNILFGNVASHHLRPLMYQNSADRPLDLHDFQLELADKALKGENTLIISPTGSGKTVIAAYIIREHIFDLQKEGKSAKIVFVVPSVPLVQQQTLVLESFLKHCASVKGLHGGCEEFNFNSLVNSVDIIVLTPQILVNAADPKLCKYDGIERFSLDAFTLIILDEVHHADKEHPYNNLMKEYHRCKYGNGVTAMRTMPQVIGLTASLGSPKNPKDVDDVINYMVNKCANFDVKSYTTINDEVAKTFGQKTKEKTIVVKNNDAYANGYYVYIKTLIKDIELYLLKIDGVLRNPEIFDGHCDITKLEYRTWLSVTKDTSLPRAKLTPASKMIATDCLIYLNTLYEAYQCAQLFPTQDTTQFYLKNLGDKNGSELDQIVYQQKEKLGKDPCFECDIFKKLVKCIKQQFAKNPNSKIIVFTTQRYYCQLGSKVMERYTGEKGIFISGANASTEEGGCNPARQSEIVKEFKDGKTRILFSTSVLDEGIDVKECNLVIKYNFVTDNIAHLQRKGRARHDDSESILITFEDKKKLMEEKNVSNIELVNKAYKRLEEKITPSMKKKMFDDAIVEYNRQRIEEEMKDALMKEKMAQRHADFVIHCKKCDAYLTDSSNLRMCTSYFIPFDPKIWTRVTFKPSTPEEDKHNREHNIGILGMIHCKNVVDDRLCDSKVGCAANFKGIMIPGLGCKELTFIEKRSEILKSCKKWKIVFQELFYPSDISHDELIAMKSFESQPIYEDVVEALGKASLEAYGALPDKPVNA